jgi:hypothetical protein
MSRYAPDERPRQTKDCFLVSIILLAMKRDMDLVREILLKVEDLPLDGRFHDVAVDGRTEEEIIYHTMLLHEAGFIEAMDLSNAAAFAGNPPASLTAVMSSSTPPGATQFGKRQRRGL